MPSDCRSCRNECGACHERFTRLHYEIDRLRELFDKYANHLGECDWTIGSSRPCTCGCEAAYRSLGLAPDGE